MSVLCFHSLMQTGRGSLEEFKGSCKFESQSRLMYIKKFFITPQNANLIIRYCKKKEVKMPVSSKHLAIEISLNYHCFLGYPINFND